MIAGAVSGFPGAVKVSMRFEFSQRDKPANYLIGNDWCRHSSILRKLGRAVPFRQIVMYLLVG
jgi:hypothetical protein